MRFLAAARVLVVAGFACVLGGAAAFAQAGGSGGGLGGLGAGGPMPALQNLGFETVTGGRPVGWVTSGAQYSVTLDSVSPFAGRYSLRSRWSDTSAWLRAPGKIARAETQYPLQLVIGRRLHLTGYIRTEGITDGYASLVMQIDSGTIEMTYDNMNTRGATGTTPWTRYDIELPVDSSATFITVGVIHPGNGTAWFDSLSLEVVGPAMQRQGVLAMSREQTARMEREEAAKEARAP